MPTPMIEALPGYAKASDAARKALDAFKPLAREKVSATATRRKVEVGGQWVPYRWDVAPYMKEPGDLITSRRFDSVAFVGPARSSKSEGLVINPLAHAILAQPRKVAVFSPTKDAAQEWSAGALDALIAASPDLSDRLVADAVFAKRFRGGMRLTADWPVKGKLAQRSLDLVIGTDYDAFPADISGEGGAFGLMRKRTEAAGSRGMTVVESSPRFAILDETWSPSSPHEAPPCDGIVGIYNQGTRARLYWTCPHCGERFIPEWGLMRYASAGSPAERGQTAEMHCPHCGGIIEYRARADLNAGAVWLHEDDGGALVAIEELQRPCPTASYWLPGPAAALAPWSRLVTRHLEAEQAFADRSDESALRSWYNVEAGLPYLPRSLSDAEALSENVLRERASAHAWQVCPAGTAFVTVAVDVQGNRFVVQVEAWAADLSRVVIDRFDIVQPPPDSPGVGVRALNPGRYAEDWRALDPLIGRAYPVAGSDYALTPLGVICDSGGPPGTTPNAYDHFRRMRRDRDTRGRFFLVKGRGGDQVKRAEIKRPETAQAGKRFAARDINLVWAGTDRLKDEIAASLMRGADGARRLSVSAGAPVEMFAEYAAERRGATGWEPRPGCKRNEALDLSVYALALVIVKQAEAIKPGSPPAWAAADQSNVRAVALPADPETEQAGRDAPSGEMQATPARTKPQPRKAGRGWSRSRNPRR